MFRRHDGQLSWEGAGQTNLKRLSISRRDHFFRSPFRSPAGHGRDASGGVNITKIGRFENHYVFLSKPMVDDRALQSDERDARVIMPRWDFATFMQMQPNGRACAQ